MTQKIEEQLQFAREFAKNQQLAESESTYRSILQTPAQHNSIIIATQETALYELGKLYQEHK